MKSFLCAGLMSGTSLDGLDVVLARIELKGSGARANILAHHQEAFPKGYSEAAQRVAKKNQLAEGRELGAVWSEIAAIAVKKTAKKIGIAISSIDVVGAHGQTVVHRPTPRKILGWKIATTLQLADLPRLALRLGVPVIGDFRSADIAAGGQGAPLAPHAHRLLFSHPHTTIAIQNVGGMGNVTLLKGNRVALAFDTGPGNIWIDTVVQWHTSGRKKFDRGGVLARTGQPNPKIVHQLLAHPYFRKKPPKSCGWEEFSPERLAPFRSALLKLSASDSVATVTEATAQATAQAYRKFIFPLGQPSLLVIAGGGAHNPSLIRALLRNLPEVPIATTDVFGVPPQQVESLCFAILALEALLGRTNTEPNATGAAYPVVGGVLARPSGQLGRRIVR